jgi:hypothetical protein
VCRRSRRNEPRLSEVSETVVRSDPTKTAASQRTSQRAKRAIRHSERQRAEQSSTGSRGAVLSQAGAPLFWTNVRAANPRNSRASAGAAGCEKVRKAAANERQPQRAERAMQTERGDTLPSPSDLNKLRERSEHQPQRRAVGRSRRLQKRDPRGASVSERSNQACRGLPASAR